VTCGRAYSNIKHHGYPESLNIGGSGWNPHVFQGHKQAWQRAFTDLMADAGLPRPLGKVFAEGQIVFPDRGRRDQGNFKFLIEKALGDALSDPESGWLEDDRFYPVSMYEFGNLQAVYRKDVAELRIMLFPAWPEDYQDAGESGTLMDVPDLFTM
jgi:hypothetical protein